MQEVRGRNRGLEVRRGCRPTRRHALRQLDHLVSPGQRRNHQPVVGGENLVVEERTWPTGPHRSQGSEAAQQPVVRVVRRQPGSPGRVRKSMPLHQDVPAVELALGIEPVRHIAVVLHSQMPPKKLGIVAGRDRELGLGPDIERPSASPCPSAPGTGESASSAV